MKPKVTPLPWFHGTGWIGSGTVDGDGIRRTICNKESTPGTIEQDEANLAFIVKACNLHEELVDAVKAMQRAFENYGEEFNPSGKPKKVCDWGQLNADLCKASAVLKKAGEE